MKHLLIIALVVSMLGGTSCMKKDLMEPLPPTSLIDSLAFDTKDRISNQIRSIYASFKSGQFYGGRYVIYNDIRGEDFINNGSNLVTGTSTWNFSLTNTAQEVQGLWSQAYNVINLANLFIEGMEAKGKAVIGDSIALDYIAEARMLRAISYYSLLQLYCRPYWDGNGSKPGLPLRLVGNKKVADYSMARSTVAQIYDQVIQDLDYAEQNLPLEYLTNKPGDPKAWSLNLSTTRGHRNTAIAFKTRVYLSMRKYEDVIREANKIVAQDVAPFSATSGTPHKMQADFLSVFKTYENLESILSMPMAAAEAPGTQNQLAYYFNAAVNGIEYRLSLEPDGIFKSAEWKASDIRRNQIYTSDAGKPSEAKWLTKYSVGSPYTDWVPVIRYSEVLLNLSEALVRKDLALNARATALLNAVRQRSDPATTITPLDFDDMISKLLIERRIEFLGEGRRSPDIMRLGLTFPAKGGVPAVPPTELKYIWPISAQELLLNTKMEDNR
ncbi:RagB/SusD family nutrient uptake outer membrane protein [Pseudoflavitalea sp. G-6-1-2]|uniref:RagB/SusD family nutrient uptake outer membrane protein n=1 Tax=Pseudoflavitalea sp. G-6-1-2 TaxID=2728841 RepID=UPI00146ED4D9|nr:RagB/SusD family nutrient uptake outer membrane protein [Pseudoflavitalea sp. G-6-1-2]NML20396.1 RagB/SusD family nutrient uptake outer membrane protein [Pseudoflavitalea sp. G-6-1-2]